jgi:tetratricopeptide (TPR) repeat protein
MVSGQVINKKLHNDVEKQKNAIEAYIKIAGICYYSCDYIASYDCLIKALNLCEKYNHHEYEPKIYTNIGNIYSYFNEYDLSKFYYEKALSLSDENSKSAGILLNNIGALELANEHIDTAWRYLDKSLKISKQYGEYFSSGMINNVASFYQKKQLYDSAFYYYHLSLSIAKHYNQDETEAINLTDLSNLFFEVNKTDSAMYYINLSKEIAEKNNFLKILSDNYLTLSKIEEAKNHHKKALEYFKKHTSLKDSVFDNKNFGDITQLQRLYEV